MVSRAHHRPAATVWLVDSRELWHMTYAEDGTWLGAEPVTDAGRIAEACLVRDAALAQSQRWTAYTDHAAAEQQH